MTIATALVSVTVLAGGWVYHKRPNRSVVLLSAVLGTVWLPFALLAPILQVLSRRARPLLRQRADRLAVTATLPDAIDLLVVAIQSGLTPELALRRLAPYLTGPLHTATQAVFTRIAHGERFGDALDALPDALGEPVRPLVAALTGSERYGLPLAPALDVVSAMSRDKRRRDAETAARKLPVRLSFPLVLCILPAFVILTVVPAIFGALRALP